MARPQPTAGSLPPTEHQSSSVLNIRDGMNGHHRARHAVQTLPSSLSQLSCFLSPAGARALSKDYGHNQEKSVCVRGHMEALAPTPGLSLHPGKRVSRLSNHCYEAHAPSSQEAKCLRLLLCSAKTSAPLSPPPLFPAPSFLSSLFPPVSFSNSSRDRSYSVSSNSHVRLSTGPCFCC